MIKMFKRNIKSEYQERLKKSFPKELYSDLNEVLKIIPFDNNQVKLCDEQTHKVDNLIHESELNIEFDNETLIIPYRLYFNEPHPELEKSFVDLRDFRTI